jgi:hypothetical protein
MTRLMFIASECYFLSLQLTVRINLCLELFAFVELFVCIGASTSRQKYRFWSIKQVRLEPVLFLSFIVAILSISFLPSTPHVFSSLDIMSKIIYSSLRPSFPSTTPDAIVRLAVSCWNSEASLRPSIAECVNLLVEELTNTNDSSARHGVALNMLASTSSACRRPVPVSSELGPSRIAVPNLPGAAVSE